MVLMRPSRRWAPSGWVAVAAVAGLVAGVGAVPAASAAAVSSSAVGVAGGLGGDAGVSQASEAAAVAEAKRTGKPVEVVAKRSESSDTVAQPDGRLLTTTYVQPRRVLRAGSWVDIDPALRVRGDGSVAPKAATADVVFSGGGSGAPLVRMVSHGRELSLSWPTALPVPVVDGATAEYRSVLPDVDLRLTATRTGFTQLLVVHSAAAAKSPALDRLQLGMKAQGLSLEEAADGSLAAVDKGAGSVVFQAPTPVMWDSSKDAVPAQAQVRPQTKSSAPAPAEAEESKGSEPGEGAKVARIAVDFPKVQDRLVLTPDQTLLEDPGTVFPVMIDPAWSTPVAAAWAGVSQYYPTQPYWHFTYNSSYVHDWGVGYCGDTSRCAPKDVKRAFFQIPSSQFVGKQIISAEFGTYESHSYSCTPSTVELWSTGSITNKLTWNSQNASGFWSSKLQSTSAAKGWGGSCPGGWLEFGGASGPVRDLVQNAANWNWPAITFGLKAANESEIEGWKKFTDDAHLRVYYNLPPRQSAMSSLTMTPGSCVSTGTTVATWPKLNAVANDPDGDAVGVQFAVGWDNGSGYQRRWWSTGTEAATPASNTFKASGSVFSVQLPTLPAPSTGAYGWDMRVWDGAAWGAWSSDGDPTSCYFFLDATAPVVPTVASSSYPVVNDPTLPLAWADGVGRYGAFTIDSPESDVVKYQWGADVAAPDHDLATTNGAPQTINVLPTTGGPHRIVVRAVDAGNNASGLVTYFFNALDGQGDRGTWSMDQSTGPQTGGATKIDATLGSGATAGATGHLGQALSFNANASTGYAQTGAAVLDTSKSYTVSAWVLFDGTPNTRVAVSQNGPDYFAYTLGVGMSGTEPRWSFKIQTDAAGADATSTSVTSTTAAPTGQWTHLTGVYDKAANSIRLYVNGVSIGSATVPSSVWDGHGAVQIGRDRWNSLWSAPWAGSVDEVKIWDRALTPAEITQVTADQVLTTGTPAKSVWHLDEPSGATAVTGAPEADALTLSGSAQTGTAGAHSSALKTGATGYARTARPVADATRSFSVSAWVRLPAITDGSTKARMVLNQTGVHNNEFSLYYSAYNKKWAFGRYKDDTTGSTLVSAGQTSCVANVPCFGPTDGQWTHLVGVSDATTKKIRLYVNGYQVGETDYTQTTPWATPGPLQLGAVSREGANDEFFGGDIDDVKVWDRIVTGPEVAAMVASQPLTAGRWKLDTQSGSPVTTPDDSPAAADAALTTGASTGSPGIYMEGAALDLDGTAGAAESTATPLHTDRSFTLTAWANTAGIPARDMTVLSVPGTSGTAVTVRWHYLRTDAGQPVGEWQAVLAGADSASPTTVTVSAAPGQSIYENWTHLAVSYDGLAGKLSLYVNGESDLSNCIAQPDNCTPRSSAQAAFLPFDAVSASTGLASLDLGRTKASGAWGQYFSGQLDDVWAFQGTLTYPQLKQLADPNTLIATTTGP